MKIDLHVHSTHSPDSITSLKKVYETAKARKLDGVALTDHNTMSGCAKLSDFARSHGDKKFLVVFGEEITTEKGDVLGLFLQEEVNARSFSRVVDEIHGQGGLVSIPHPFDPRRTKAMLPNALDGKLLSRTDCIEVFNSRSASSANSKAREFALKKNKGFTAGSDAHWWFEIGRAVVEANAFTEEELRTRLLKRQCKVSGRNTSILTLGLTLGVRNVRKIIK